MDPSDSTNLPGANTDIPPADGPGRYSGPPRQMWTVDGYPIVDGKYLDLSTGELKTHV